jgi:hypothetical protein
MINTIRIYPLIIYKRTKDNVEFVYDFQLAEQVEVMEIGKTTSARERFVTEQSPAF